MAYRDMRSRRAPRIGLPVPVRRSFLGDTGWIAGTTATGYLVALAYRAMQLYSYGLPVSMATVKLSDAAFVGLFVLVGGISMFISIDALESSQPGASWRFLLVALFTPFTLFAVVIAVLFWVGLWVPLGGGFAFLAALVVLIILFVLLLVGLQWFLKTEPKMDALEAIARRYPGFTIAVLMAFVLCLFAGFAGYWGLRMPGNNYLLASSGTEVVVAVVEDRVLLAGVEPDPGEDAVLTGSFRILPLPSEEVTFTQSEVQQLKRRPR